MNGTAIVTGCAGFIGSHLCERLVAQGWDVVGVDCFDDAYPPRLKHAHLEQLRRSPRFRLETVDLAEAQAVQELAGRVRADVVVHLAALPGVRLSVTEPARYVRSNVVATQNVLDAWCRAGATPLVFASSSSVYGRDSRAPFSEEEPCVSPSSPYAATKRSAELLCRVHHSLHGTPVTVLRLFTAYGRRQRPDLAIRRFGTALLRGEELPVFGNGEMARDFTHVADLVDGIVAAMTRTNGFLTLNLGSSSPVSLRELVGKLETAFRRPARIKYIPRPLGEMGSTCADVTRAREILGWSPRRRLDDGLADFAEWLAAEEAGGRNP